MKNNLMTVEKYASNESFQAYCFKTDEAAMLHWTEYLANNPDQKSIIEEAKKIVEFLQLQLSEKEILAEKEKIKPYFDKMVEKAKNESSSDRTFNIWLKVASIAAAIGLLIFAGVNWTKQKTNQETIFITQTFSEQTKVQLSDGSTIFLAANASIRHEEEWTQNKNREVWLTGKAFFKVTNKPIVGNQQFIVHTNQGKVEVLGTSFTIDDDKDNYEVILETGEIAFHGINQQTVILRPGEKVGYEKGLLKKENVNAAYYSVWKEDELVFEDTPVYQIVEVLKASFDMDLKVEDQRLLKRKVTASIPKNDPELLLQALSEIYDIRIIRSDGQIILK